MNADATNQDKTPHDDRLDRQLAALDQNSAAPADSTLRNLHEQLETMAHDLRQPPPEDPHEQESALRDAADRLREIGRNPSPETLARMGAERTAASPAPTQLGPYRLLEKLGQGGMGAVYKALHSHLEKVVALKILASEKIHSEQAVARFEREMKAVGKLDHPHIVRAMDAGQADGVHYLVMEYVSGIDLSEVIRRSGPLPVATACELVRQAAEGLEAAHRRGMVHRDIKPANLMLAKQEFGPPVVKVLDLGLALLAEAGAEETEGLTADGHVMGTIDYMAPEQAGDSHGVDIRADIFSLGATLYALLTGGSIFQDRGFKSIVQKLSALATESAPPLRQRRPDAPAELCAVVARMLSHDPAERYATPAEVVAALEPLTDGADLAALLTGAGEAAETNASVIEGDMPLSSPKSATRKDHSVTPSARLARSGRRRRPIIAAATALGFGGIVLLGLILLSLRTPYGEVVVELGGDVPADIAKQLKIEVRGDGNLQVADAAHGWTIDVEEGKYSVKLAGRVDRVELDKNQIVVSRDRKEIVRVTLKPADGQDETTPSAAVAAVSREPSSWKPTPEQQAFFDSVAKLEPEAQVEAVRMKLTEENPAFDGEVATTITRNRVVELRFVQDEITTIWPVRALANLEGLYCYGSTIENRRLAELSPLAGMKLKKLHCNGTLVSDLTPLAGTPLEELVVNFTEVSDLTPLEGMQLESLHVRRTRVTDLSPLLGMPLSTLSCGETNVSDFSPLKGMALKALVANSTHVRDLSPLARMPITSLNIGQTRVSDLSPLRGMPLENLTFTPHYFDPREENLLRSLPLKTINGRMPEEFWKSVAARRTAAEMFQAETADLPPEARIEAVKERLNDVNTYAIGSLGTVVEDGHVVAANFVLNKARDVAPLRAFPKLKRLTLSGGESYVELSPITALPLEELNCTADIAVRNVVQLRGMASLKTINGQPAKEYLDGLTKEE
jgi:serine/threonine protein kinase/Leucine-rich repeat (LRR) protein